MACLCSMKGVTHHAWRAAAGGARFASSGFASPGFASPGSKQVVKAFPVFSSTRGVQECNVFFLHDDAFSSSLSKATSASQARDARVAADDSATATAIVEELFQLPCETPMLLEVLRGHLKNLPFPVDGQVYKVVRRGKHEFPKPTLKPAA
jgi:hypothetical protein